MNLAPGRPAYRERLWIGGYTSDMGGTARGVTAAELADDGTVAELRLVAPAPSPSFVAEHPFLPVLYAIAEDDGVVRAFAIAAGGALEPLGEPVDAGSGPCHISIDPSGSLAAIACYGSGRVTVCTLDPASGAIIARAETEPARDPHAPAATAGHRRASRAHYCEFLPDGRLLTTDLGFDLARVWRRSPDAAGFELDHEVVFPLGTGPRHVAAAPDGRLYVVCEDSVAVYALALEPAGRYAIAASSPLRRAPREDGEYAAHVSLSADGSLLYATIRGSNVVAVLRVGADGTPEPIAEVPSGGNWPRHHVVVGRRLYVANQLSDEVSVFRLGADGVPSDVIQRFRTGSPAVLVPSAAGSCCCGPRP